MSIPEHCCEVEPEDWDPKVKRDPEFHCTGGGGRDDTYCYDITFYEPYTLDEFVGWILKKKPNEFGDIEVRIHPNPKSMCVISYDKGNAYGSKEYDEIKDKVILSGSCRSGWWRSDYSFTLAGDHEEKERNEPAMYDCPIKTFFETGPLIENIGNTMEGHIISAVQKIGIDVNKEELIKALNNDRSRYEEAYQKGWNDCVRHYASFAEELAKLINGFKEAQDG